MKIIRAKDYNDMSRKAANIISAQVILKPESVLGLATGSSPIGIYEQLIKWYHKGDVDFGACTTFNLDEYRGLTPDHDQSYHYFMHKNFFDAVNVPDERINLPDGAQLDAERECSRYDKAIRAAGGIDLQLLGMGLNGHIGFNEPDEYFSKGTHCVNLTESTIEANKRFSPRPMMCPRSGLHHGRADHHARATHRSGRFGRKQGENRPRSLLRPGNAARSGIHPSASYRRFHRRGRGCALSLYRSSLR